MPFPWSSRPGWVGVTSATRESARGAQTTLAGASRIPLGETLGRVEAGMLADLVVLAVNPLEEISNVRRVELVVHQGRRHRP